MLNKKSWLSTGLLTFWASAGLMFGQSDVTQPGDPVIASSDNSPGSEGVANAIDNQPTKYLNFDILDTGLTVTPSVGATLVTGLNLTSANDAPDRDPSTYVLEGSNDGVNFMEISTGDVPAFADRFDTVNISFDNSLGFKTYRLRFPTVYDSTCCMQISEIEFLGEALSPDVTQPGDAIVATSDNSPGSEGVANAIDNQPTKYLNFDILDTGFTVTPSVGATIVSGISLTSANDAPDRDPSNYTIEGSNDGGTTFELVASGDVPLFPDRFTTIILPFENTQPYETYRVIFPLVYDSTCCMQISEVELLGTVAPQDVTQPGDEIVATSDNSPGSEGVANAIDNQPTKYLNFDILNTGFTVTPSVGETIISGISLTSANDAPDRDPTTYTIEGSNDGGATFEFIVDGQVDAFADRFVTQTFFFDNTQAYETYRVIFPTVGGSTCCMQISEVELLGFAASSDALPQFRVQPVDTPVLIGSSATFYIQVNGPWAIQWYKNGERIPGASQLTYTTEPVTAENAGDVYTATAANGALVSTSEEAMIEIFTPSSTKSVGVSFNGGGANGAPTAMNADDIAGAWQQAYWNTYADANGFHPGTDADGNPTSVLDSDGNESGMTFDFSSTGTWGSGTGTLNADRRMLNGLVQGDGSISFGNVPDGNHALLIYSVARPLEFPNINFTLNDANGTREVFMRQLNADEYNPAPGFFRVNSSVAGARNIGNYVRFDNVQPNFGSIILDWANAGGGSSTINGVQLILNAPDPGNPPAITSQPKSVSAVIGENIALGVTATGTAPLSYQWRLNGANLVNGPKVSGVQEATLSLNGVTAAQAGKYTVAVSNAAGTVISTPAVVSITTGDISDRLSQHFTFDAADNGAAQFVGFTNADYVSGQVGGALQFNEGSYIIIDEYDRPTDGLAVSMWIKPDTSNFGSPHVPRLIGNFVEGQPFQFRLGYVWPGTSDSPMLEGQLQVGPNTPNAQGPEGVPASEWTHLLFTADGAQMRIYQNGELLTTGDYLGNLSAGGTTPLVIGAFLAEDLTPNPTTGLPDFYIGLMDDVGLWGRSLSEAEVTAIYEAGMAGESLSTVVIDRDVAKDPVPLTVALDGSEIVVSWPEDAPFTLQSTDALGGDWTNVDGVEGTTYRAAADGDAKFFRLVQ